MNTSLLTWCPPSHSPGSSLPCRRRRGPGSRRCGRSCPWCRLRRISHSWRTSQLTLRTTGSRGSRNSTFCFASLISHEWNTGEFVLRAMYLYRVYDITPLVWVVSWFRMTSFNFVFNLKFSLCFDIWRLSQYILVDWEQLCKIDFNSV